MNKTNSSVFEHKSISTGLTVDKEIHKHKWKEYEELRCRTKWLYYTEADLNGDGNQGKLFSIINYLLHRTGSSPLPGAYSNEMLANDFSNFFFAKIAKIHDKLAAAPRPFFVQPDPPQYMASFNENLPVSKSDIAKIMNGALFKACTLDPIPIKIFKLAIPTLIPVITDIVNESLRSEVMPDSLKKPWSTLCLKSPILTHNI